MGLPTPFAKPKPPAGHLFQKKPKPAPVAPVAPQALPPAVESKCEPLPPGKPPAPHELLSKEHWGLVYQTLKEGAFRETAARRVEIDIERFELWMSRGKNDRTLEGKYRLFMQMVEKAEAEAEMYHLARLNSGAPKWESSAWWLEHHFPDRWGKKGEKAKASAAGKGDDPREGKSEDEQDPIAKLSRLLAAQDARSPKTGSAQGDGAGSSPAAPTDVAVLGQAGTASTGDAGGGKPT